MGRIARPDRWSSVIRLPRLPRIPRVRKQTYYSLPRTSRLQRRKIYLNIAYNLGWRRIIKIMKWTLIAFMLYHYWNWCRPFISYWCRQRLEFIGGMCSNRYQLVTLNWNIEWHRRWRQKCQN